jgi:hypothetical protein
LERAGVNARDKLTYSARKLIEIVGLKSLDSCMMNLIKEYKSWNLIKWDEVHVNVLNLQTKIYKYSESENINQMRYFQRKLVNSKHAKLLAVRVVSKTIEVKRLQGLTEYQN